MNLPDWLNPSFAAGAATGALALLFVAFVLAAAIVWIARDCDHD